MTTDQIEFLDGMQGGLPITYSKTKVPKEIIDDSTLHEADIKSFNTRIGFITNCSTTLYSMLEDESYGNIEKQELTNRLKICRKEQGNQIDKAKGLIVKPFPKSWTRKSTTKDVESQEELDKINFSNRLVISKRPYFMRWLYSDYNRDYRRYMEAKEIFCRRVLKQKLEDFLLRDKSDFSEKESDFLSAYLKNNPLLDSGCLMNKICHHMEKSVSEIKIKSKSKTTDEIVDILKDVNMEVENLDEKIKKMSSLYDKYKKFKKTMTIISESGEENRANTIEQYNKILRQQAFTISTNMAELANIAIAVCYVDNKDSGFVWNLFGEGLVENIKKTCSDNILLPFLDGNGDVEYMGNKYSMKQIEIGEELNDYIL
jgi:uncharacterized protein YktA (UPF0223 family)